ncbi:MAG: FecR domain-containing protein [Rhodopila sp.]
MLTAAAVTALMVAANTPSVARPAGTVADVGGPSTIGGHPAHQGDAVQVGDGIATASDGAIKLQMVDRSVLMVAPGTSMTVTRYDWTAGARDVQLTVKQGLLRLTVPAIAGSSSYTVSTVAGPAAMKSAAAEWFVAVDARSAQVGVLEGSVTLTSPTTQRSVTIPGHWGTRLEIGLNPVLPRAWSQVEFDGFIRRTQCCQSPMPKPQ